MRNAKKVMLILLANLIILGIFASSFNPTDELPLDASVIVGTLENGLTYYIRQNSEPNNLAMFMLALKAGAILEDDDQQGVAHFVEHTAFSGTENFPEYSIREYLDSIGFGFMGGLNAATSIEFTIYMMQSRTDDDEQVDKAIQIMSEWSARVTFDEEMVEKERGIILEEIRGRRGALERMQKQIWSVLFEGSRYAERMPAGLPEIVENIPRQRIVDYYNDWYRPDMQAVIAVGDFADVEEVREMIQKHFGNIPFRENPRVITEFIIPEHDETKFAFNTDPEADMTLLAIWHKLPHDPVETIADYRYRLIDTLLYNMLSNRFTELSRQPDSPFIQAGATKMTNMFNLDLFVLQTMLDEHRLVDGSAAMITEIERAKQHGFHSSELIRAKNAMLSDIERRYSERDNTMSMRHVMTAMYHFLDNNPMMSLEDEFEIVSYILPTIDLDDILRAIDENLSEENRVVSLNAPENIGVELPSEETMLELFETIKETELELFPETVIEEPLMSRIPKRVRVRKPRFDKENNIYTWNLKNGATVYLKPTDFRSNEILFSSYRKGGLSQIEDDIFFSAQAAPEIISESGLGAFDKTMLDIYLDDKNVRLNARISQVSESMSGSSTVTDFETLMQMVWLNYHQPRFDEAAFDRWKQRSEIFIRNQENSPDFAFENAINNLLYDNHFRMQELTMDELQVIDHRASFDFFKSRFDSADGVNFFFVGNISSAELHRYIEIYLATLPKAKTDTQIIDREIRYNQSSARVEVRRGQDDRTNVRLIFTNDYIDTISEQYTALGVSLILTQMLIENVREKMSGVYFIMSYFEPDIEPYPQIALNIMFGCDPHRIDEIVDEINNQLNLLIENEFEERFLISIKETLKQMLENGMRTNNYWLSQMVGSIAQNYSFSDIANIPLMIENATRDDVSELTKRYVDFEKKLMIILYPEAFE